eukprot:2568870-Pyramimonas_sp.AAC.1
MGQAVYLYAGSAAAGSPLKSARSSVSDRRAVCTNTAARATRRRRITCPRARPVTECTPNSPQAPSP